MRFVRVLLLVVAIGAATAAVLVLVSGSGGTDLGTLWHGSAPESLNLTQAVTQRYIHPAIWTQVILPLLLMPAAGAFIVIAAICALLYSVTLLVKRRKQK